MRIAIFGAGAVGGYFGGRLAEAGRDVVFVARGAHLEALREHGLRIDSIAGDYRIVPVTASDDPAELGVVDAVLVAVKAWQTARAAATLEPLIGPDTFIVPLMNGVEAPAQLADALGGERILGGLCGLISTLAGPGHIRHLGAPPFVSFGELDNRRSTRAERLLAAFEGCVGVSAYIPDDIQAAMWRKFMLIAAMSGVGGVTRAPVGELRARSETRTLIEQAMRETLAVGRAHGIALDDEAVTTSMGFIDALPEEAMASMQRDILAGRPSELEGQNGAVVRLGRAADVATPVHSFLYASLLPQELRARA